MEIKTGCDIVAIERFERSMKKGGRRFLDKIFSTSELAGTSTPASLAGRFAAKEAVIKALEMKAGDWLKIEIRKEKSGRPQVKLLELNKRIVSQDVSISHDGVYAMAVVVLLLK